MRKTTQFGMLFRRRSVSLLVVTLSCVVASSSLAKSQGSNFCLVCDIKYSAATKNKPDIIALGALDNVNSPGNQKKTANSNSEKCSGLQGIITKSNGKVFSGALIIAEMVSDGASPVPDIAVITDRRGFYCYPLDQGTYKVFINGYSDQSKLFNVDKNRYGIGNIRLK